MTGPVTVKTNAPKKQKANWFITVILVILIAITIMAILSAKKYFEVGRAISPEDLRIREFSNVVNSSPENIPARVSLAYEFQKAGRYDEAREQYLEVLNVDPDNAAANYNLGVVAEATQDFDEAEKIYKELVKKTPSHLLGNLSLSQIYLKNKKYDEAIKVVDSVLKYSHARSKVEFYFVKGQAYEGKKDKKKALEAYKAVLEFVPDDQEALAAIERLK